ncbi:hypothetical protein EVAR_50550_1 [Eumeta japonica]|uniref:PiggyBac transposable element-derived protein domain-containing protein n=1 Tax=Eumeta variegata TaxID=151549 RepID=A0A4C2AHN5_EUMVA|nr:hypothetical protein EVAR_50550_1 [Eumeta japonica]
MAKERRGGDRKAKFREKRSTKIQICCGKPVLEPTWLQHEDGEIPHLTLCRNTDVKKQLPFVHRPEYAYGWRRFASTRSHESSIPESVVEPPEAPIIPPSIPSGQTTRTSRQGRRRVWKQVPFEDGPHNYMPIPTKPVRRPVDYFRDYFDDDFIEKISHCTNLYYLRSTGRELKCTSTEITKLLAIHIIMGCVPYPGCLCIESWWLKQTETCWAENFVMTTSEGLMLDFAIYEGAKTMFGESNLGLGPSVILSLAKSIPPGSCVYHDRYFTTVPLIEEMEKLNLHSTGDLAQIIFPVPLRHVNKILLCEEKRQRTLCGGYIDRESCQYLKTFFYVFTNLVSATHG